MAVLTKTTKLISNNLHIIMRLRLHFAYCIKIYTYSKWFTPNKNSRMLGQIFLTIPNLSGHTYILVGHRCPIKLQHTRHSLQI